MINASGSSLTGSNGYCMKQCLGATEYWTGVAVNTCATCPMWCNGCTGGTSSDCTSCNAGYNLESNPGFCRKICLSTEYNDGNLTNACQTCHAQCLTCNGGLNTECLSCRAGSTLNGSFCGIDCPIGQYNTGPSANTCAACHSDCQTCSGPNSNQCLSCPSPKFVDGSQCVASCPNGTWLNGINCDSCSPCTLCTRPSYCTSCEPTHRLSGNTCILKCTATQYYDTSTGACANCNASCGTCTGPSATECMLCAAPLIKDHKGSTCRTCKKNCATCGTIDPTKCSSCPAWG